MEKKKPNKNNKIFNILFYGIISILSILIITLSAMVVLGKVNSFDQDILIWVSGMRSPILTRLMILFSEFCNVLFLIVVVLFIIILVKDKIFKILVVINSLGVYLLCSFIKILIARPRPEYFMLVPETSYSFPSGHTIVSSAFYGIIAYFCYKKIKNKSLKIIVGIGLVMLILLISFSRLYLGVHHLTDIVTSLMISAIILLVEFKVINKRK